MARSKAKISKAKKEEESSPPRSPQTKSKTRLATAAPSSRSSSPEKATSTSSTSTSKRLDFFIDGIEDISHINKTNEEVAEYFDSEEEEEARDIAIKELGNKVRSYELRRLNSDYLGAYIDEKTMQTSPMPRGKSLRIQREDGHAATVLQAMPQSGVEIVEIVAEQSWLITKLTVQLLWAFRISRKWILYAIRLIWFVCLLLPAFLRGCFFWIFSENVHKNIIYGLKGRNLLDVYTVPHSSLTAAAAKQNAQRKTPIKHPVVVFLSGGAWIIGYKAWGAFMGKALSAFGIVVVTPDYRNFPQGVAPDMIEDVMASLQWVFENIHHFGGDPDNVTLVGQSAGAHLGACTLLEMIEKKSSKSMYGSFCASPAMSTKSINSTASYSSSTTNLNHQQITWDLKNIRSFIGISGPYNIEASMELFHRHGFDRSIVERIMDNKIAYYSPSLRLYAKMEIAKHTNAFEDFPPVYLFHGTADKTCPWNSSDQFLDALEACGITSKAKYFEGKSHTDPILEDPIIGDDFLLLDIIEILKENSPKDQEQFKFGQFVPEKTYYPRILVRLARAVNPF